MSELKPFKEEDFEPAATREKPKPFPVVVYKYRWWKSLLWEFKVWRKKRRYAKQTRKALQCKPQE